MKQHPEDVSQAIGRLQAKGWSLTTIGEAIDVPRNTLIKWKTMERYPIRVKMLLDALAKLETRKRIPRKPRGRVAQRIKQAQQRQLGDA